MKFRLKFFVFKEIFIFFVTISSFIIIMVQSTVRAKQKVAIDLFTFKNEFKTKFGLRGIFEMYF